MYGNDIFIGMMIAYIGIAIIAGMIKRAWGKSEPKVVDEWKFKGGGGIKFVELDEPERYQSVDFLRESPWTKEMIEEMVKARRKDKWRYN